MFQILSLGKVNPMVQAGLGKKNILLDLISLIKVIPKRKSLYTDTTMMSVVVEIERK